MNGFGKEGMNKMGTEMKGMIEGMGIKSMDKDGNMGGHMGQRMGNMGG